MSLTATKLDSRQISAFERDLTDLEARIEKEETAQLDFASGVICPIETKNKPECKRWEYRQSTVFGSWAKMNNYTTDIPTVNVAHKSFSREIFKWATSYQYSDDDILASRAVGGGGMDLIAEYIQAIRETYNQQLNQLVAYGDPDSGMPGFLNNPDCLKTYAPHRLDSTSTAEEKLAVLHHGAYEIVRRTRRVEAPDTMLLDLNTHQILSSEIIRIGDTALDKTLLEHFLQTNPYIKQVAICNELDPEVLAENQVEASNMVVFFNRNPKKVKAKVYQPLTFKEPRRAGGVDIWKRPAVMKYGGIDLRRPMSMNQVLFV